MLILWPILWILAMVGLIVATVVAGMRDKKTRVKVASQNPQPMHMGQDEMAPLDADADGFGSPDGGFGDDPFK